MIKKFKNGNIRLYAPKKGDYLWLEDGSIDERYYHDVMFMSDLYLKQINVYMYLVDFNTSLVYELDLPLFKNPLTYILETIAEDGLMNLYPLGKRESKMLLQDLENGY